MRFCNYPHTQIQRLASYHHGPWADVIDAHAQCRPSPCAHATYVCPWVYVRVYQACMCVCECINATQGMLHLCSTQILLFSLHKCERECERVRESIDADLSCQNCRKHDYLSIRPAQSSQSYGQQYRYTWYLTKG